MNRKLLDEHPPKFKKAKEELEYCQQLMDEYRITNDTWIGQGNRVVDRLVWFLRRMYPYEHPSKKE